MRDSFLVSGVVILIASSFAFGGVHHRDDCEHAGKVSCSVLFWDDGEKPAAPRLTLEQRSLLQEARAAAADN